MSEISTGDRPLDASSPGDSVPRDTSDSAGLILGVDSTVPAISARGLTKTYGAHVALKDVSIDIPVGSVCGLIGPNGAGKSTFLSIAATLLKPTAGSVSVFGIPITQPRDIRPLLGYVPDVLGIYSGLTVEEYLNFFAGAYDIPRELRPELLSTLLSLVDLESKRHADLNSLSRGMKQRIALARALIHEPKILILDEPASGLDPRARIELREIVSYLNANGTTVLISSHILGELEEMCSHAMVIEQGRLLGFEDLAEVGEQRRVEITYIDGTVELYEVDGAQGQANLVAKLVSEGREVLTVSGGKVRLEQRFLDATAGLLN